MNLKPHCLALQLLGESLDIGLGPAVVGLDLHVQRVQVEPGEQVAEAFGEADHAEVVGLRQASFVTGGRFQQLLLQRRQVGLDGRCGAGRQAFQVAGKDIGHAPQVGRVEPGVGMQVAAGAQGDAG